MTFDVHSIISGQLTPWKRRLHIPSNSDNTNVRGNESIILMCFLLTLKLLLIPQQKIIRNQVLPNPTTCQSVLFSNQSPVLTGQCECGASIIVPRPEAAATTGRSINFLNQPLSNVEFVNLFLNYLWFWLDESWVKWF